MYQNFLSEKVAIAKALGEQYLQHINNMSRSTLRAESLLTNTGKVSFNVIADKANNPWGSEVLLQNNDMFIATEVAITLLKRVDTDRDNIANYNTPQHSYLNQRVFAAANDVNIQAIYNGKLVVKKDRKEYIPAIPMNAFERVGLAQNDNTAPATSITARDSKEVGMWGFYPSDIIQLTGDDTLDIDIELPVNADMSGGNSYAVLEYRGYLLTNALQKLGRY